MFPTEITVVASVSRLYLNWYTIVSLIYYTYLCPTWSDELWFKTPIKKQKNKKTNHRNNKEKYLNDSALPGIQDPPWSDPYLPFQSYFLFFLK